MNSLSLPVDEGALLDGNSYSGMSIAVCIKLKLRGLSKRFFVFRKHHWLPNVAQTQHRQEHATHPGTSMNNRSFTMSLLFTFACLLPANVQARFDLPVVYVESSAANSNCSGERPVEMLSLQPDGKVIVSILVVAEETKTPIADLAVPETPAVAVVVPVSTPQFEIHAPVYSVPVQTYYPTFQPQAAVCTSGG